MQAPISKTRSMTIAAVLTAVGIIIPMIMPIKVMIGPASYTLASHVPINMAMFVSPLVTAVVALGTTLGFQVAGFPVVIVARAFTHLIYASIGARIIQEQKQILTRVSSRFLLNLGLNLVHALGEVLVVYLFTSFGLSPMSDNFFYVLVVLVGLGTLIHGMVDFELSYQFTGLLQKRTGRTFVNFA